MYSLAQSFLDLNVTNNTSFASKYINELESSDNATLEVKAVVNDPSKDELKSKLTDYRKNKSLKMNVPAYYIFTNDEYDKIIELRPKTIEELGKIISPIKVKCHGQEIIDLIKKNN